MSETWTVRQILNWTTGRFKELDIPTALLDAQLLICAALGLDKIALYTQIERPLTMEERGVLKELVKRRMAGEPVAYILRQKFWHDLDLYVDGRVLIPRPETETLLDLTLEVGKKRPELTTVIFDFCTGSGCLALALAKRFPHAKVVGVDISSDALEVAELNKKRNAIENVTFVEGDVTSLATTEKLVAEFGLPGIVVANPPYVRESEWAELDVSVSKYEPRLALVSGSEGLDVAAAMSRNLEASGVMKGPLFLALELASGHPEQLAALLKKELVANAVDPFTVAELLPLHKHFGVRDLEQRSRYLCYLS